MKRLSFDNTLVATLIAFVLKPRPVAEVEALPLAEAIEAEAA